MAKRQRGRPQKRRTADEQVQWRREYQRKYYLEHREKAKEYQRLYNLRTKKKRTPRQLRFTQLHAAEREAVKSSFTRHDLQKMQPDQLVVTVNRITAGARSLRP